jgi:hypothetical protein
MNVNFTVTSVLDPGYSALAAVKGAIRAVLYQGAGKYFWRARDSAATPKVYLIDYLGTVFG